MPIDATVNSIKDTYHLLFLINNIIQLTGHSRLANELRQDEEISVKKRRIYSHTEIEIYNDEGRMINVLKLYLYQKVNGKGMSQHIQKKYNWDRFNNP